MMYEVKNILSSNLYDQSITSALLRAVVFPFKILGLLVCQTSNPLLPQGVLHIIISMSGKLLIQGFPESPSDRLARCKSHHLPAGISSDYSTRSARVHGDNGRHGGDATTTINHQA